MLPLARAAGVAATILTLAVGCDKARRPAADSAGAAGAARGARAAGGAEAYLDLSARPDILFQVFGERDDPRMIPVAAVRNGELVPITLSPGSWRRFDAMYLRSGASYTLYHDGMSVGGVKVRQGMWERPDDPLYKLAQCEQLVPLAAVSVTGVPSSSYTIEFFASSARMGKPAAGASMAPAEVSAIAKRIGVALAKAEDITPQTLDSLDFRALAFSTGATSRPTIVASFIDPSASGGGGSGGGGADGAAPPGESAHLFAIADARASSYTVTYDHVVRDPSARAEYRRFVDHLDVDGNGVDEIILEGWQEAGRTFLIVLAYRDGAWTEVFRGRSSWCLDRRG